MTPINSSRFNFVWLCRLLLFGLAVPASGQSVNPSKLYRGENVLTVSSSRGIERISVSPSSDIRVEAPSGMIRGCPTSVEVRVWVDNLTAGSGVGFTIFECDGNFHSESVSVENWTIRHEFTGKVEIGSDTCLQCFIESREPRLVDSITVNNPDMSVRIAASRRGAYYRVQGGVPFLYNVCYKPTKTERSTDSIYLHLHRDFPAGGLNDYVIAKPITVEAVLPPPPPVPKKLPEPELPPLRDPTTFRNIVMPTAESPKKGTFFYGNYIVVGNLGGYGLTDRLSLLAGAVLVPDFISRLYLGTFGAKYEFLRLGDIRAAVGGELAFSTTENSDIRTIAPYLVTSYGNEENRLSVAFGYGVKRHVTPMETFDRNALTFAIGGNVTISRGWKMAAEAYAIQTSGIAPLVITARKFTESFAFDFGLGIDLKEGSDIIFTDGLSGEIDRLAIAPILSAMWTF